MNQDCKNTAETGRRGGEKLGIMGGTFDPVHKAHVWLAAAAAKFAGLDKVIFLPALRAPLRGAPNSASPADRVNMLKLALRDFPYPFEIELCEIENPGLAYSIDTADFLLKKHPGARLNWIIGDDHLQKLKNWKDAKLLCAKVGFICAPRQDGLLDLPPELSPLPNPEEILAARLSARAQAGERKVEESAGNCGGSAGDSGNSPNSARNSPDAAHNSPDAARYPVDDAHDSANGAHNPAGAAHDLSDGVPNQTDIARNYADAVHNPAGGARSFSPAGTNSSGGTNSPGGCADSQYNARTSPPAGRNPHAAAVNPGGGGTYSACARRDPPGGRAAAVAKIARILDALEVPQNAHIEFIPFKKMPHSATMIRAMLSKCGGENRARELDCMLDFRVLSYIKSHQLYGIAEGAIPHSQTQNDKP